MSVTRIFSSPVLTFWTFVVCVVVFCIHDVFLFDGFIGNEIDTLPNAYHSFNKDWLVNDWYLNLDIRYRGLFNSMFGWAVQAFGFQGAAFLGRIITYILFGIATSQICRSLKLNPWVFLLCLIVFINFQSMAAGEWLVGGIESKVLAYLSVLFAMSFYLKQRLGWALFFVGLAVSFHVLVGGFCSFCLVFAAILSSDNTWGELKKLIGRSWAFLIPAAPGLYVVSSYLTSSNSNPCENGWLTYVENRVGHHVNPSEWDTNLWIIFVFIFVIISIIVLLKDRNRQHRFLAYFGLGSLILFFVGYSLYLNDNLPLLRFYWFRVPDTMVPFLISIFIAIGTKALFSSNIPNRLTSQITSTYKRIFDAAPMWVIVVVSAVYLYGIFWDVSESPKFAQRSSFDYEMTQWIKSNTSGDAIFIIPPYVFDFYISADRATIATYKHSPQDCHQIEEWHQRFDDVYARGELQADGTHRYYLLGEDDISEISTKYGAQYMITSTDIVLNFTAVFSSQHHTLYEISR